MLKKNFFLHGTYLKKTLPIVSYVFDWLYFTHCLTSLCTVSNSISSNVDDVPFINPSAVFVFGDFKVHHKDWLTYSGGPDWPVEFCYNFCISNDLTQMINFPTRIPDYDSHNPALLYLCLSSDASICFTMAFPPFGNSDHPIVSVFIDFSSNSQWEAPFLCIAYDFSCWLGWSSWSFERCSMGGYL